MSPYPPVPKTERPLVLTHVRIITWKPSQDGRISTDRVEIGVSFWVPDQDEVLPTEQKGADYAVDLAKRQSLTGVEYLGLAGVEVTELRESYIKNQPKRFGDGVGLREAGKES